MTQNTFGWRSFLSLPGIYGYCQNVLRRPGSRAELVKKYIRPKQGMHILDLGCGPATILKYLPENIHYVGVDVSIKYIEAAKATYGDRGHFYCLPVEALHDAGIGGFDLVMGLGVLHHLDDDQARSFFAIAFNVLKMDGRCLTVDPCFVQGRYLIAGILIRMDWGKNIRTADRYAALAKDTFSHITYNIHHDRLRVPYTHHIMECRR